MGRCVANSIDVVVMNKGEEKFIHNILVTSKIYFGACIMETPLKKSLFGVKILVSRLDLLNYSKDDKLYDIIPFKKE